LECDLFFDLFFWINFLLFPFTSYPPLHLILLNDFLIYKYVFPFDLGFWILFIALSSFHIYLQCRRQRHLSGALLQMSLKFTIYLNLFTNDLASVLIFF